MLQVEVGADEDDLPLTYEPARIAEFWSRRPVAVLTRVAQLLSIGGGFLTGVLWDLANGSFGKNEVGPTDFSAASLPSKPSASNAAWPVWVTLGLLCNLAA